MGQNLTPAQRAALFEQATRQHIQTLGTMTFAESSTLSQQLPKSRFLSRTFLQVKGTYKAAHATKEVMTLSVGDKYNLLRQIQLKINNGFSPYQISGAMLFFKNKIDRFRQVTDSTYNTLDYMTNVVSSAGADNSLSFMLELPNVINNRDSVGLINLQHGATTVDLVLDCDSMGAICTDTDIVFSDIAITITPVVESFSIPQDANFIPDYNILKIVNEQKENVVGNGDTTIKLPCGLTYRKLFLYVASDTAKTAIPLANISNVQVIFNQADIPYNVPASFLANKNAIDYGNSLPAGMYALDLSAAGIANYSSGRDYIDTENLTECWLRVSFTGLTGNTNYITVVSEKLAVMGS